MPLTTATLTGLGEERSGAVAGGLLDGGDDGDPQAFAGGCGFCGFRGFHVFGGRGGAAAGQQHGGQSGAEEERQESILFRSEHSFHIQKMVGTIPAVGTDMEEISSQNLPYCSQKTTGQHIA